MAASVFPSFLHTCGDRGWLGFPGETVRGVKWPVRRGRCTRAERPVRSRGGWREARHVLAPEKEGTQALRTDATARQGLTATETACGTHRDTPPCSFRRGPRRFTPQPCPRLAAVAPRDPAPDVASNRIQSSKPRSISRPPGDEISSSPSNARCAYSLLVVVTSHIRPRRIDAGCSRAALDQGHAVQVSTPRTARAATPGMV